MCQKCDNKELRKELEAVTLERDLLRKQVEVMGNELEKVRQNGCYPSPSMQSGGTVRSHKGVSNW